MSSSSHMVPRGHNGIHECVSFIGGVETVFFSIACCAEPVSDIKKPFACLILAESSETSRRRGDASITLSSVADLYPLLSVKPWRHRIFPSPKNFKHPLCSNLKILTGPMLPQKLNTSVESERSSQAHREPLINAKTSRIGPRRPPLSPPPLY